MGEDALTGCPRTGWYQRRDSSSLNRREGGGVGVTRVGQGVEEGKELQPGCKINKGMSERTNKQIDGKT